MMIKYKNIYKYLTHLQVLLIHAGNILNHISNDHNFGTNRN